MERKSDKMLIGFFIIYILIICCFAVYYSCFRIDREEVSEEFFLDLTDDVKLVSYKDDSFLIAIDAELVVEVDDAEKFLQNNIKCGIEKGIPGSGDDYQYSDGKRIYIRIEPYDGKYRVHLNHME